MYHESVLDKLLSYVRRHALLRPGDRVGVAVSGGADSVGLLRLLLDAREQLGIVLSVVHFNHKIRGPDADADEAFVRDLARRWELEFHSDSDDTPAHAREHKLSLEAAGRALRYAFFHRLVGEGTVHRVATAHTRDDQAETVLMRLLRGAGTKGLAGIHPGIGGCSVMGCADEKPPIPQGPSIIRPLLEVSRAELRAYLDKLGQSWREDASNLDLSFARNRLRHEVGPLLRQLNPNLDQVLSDTAEIAREEESWWSEQTRAAQEDLWAVPHEDPQHRGFEPPRMRVDALLSKPLALQRRLVRSILEKAKLHLDFHHVEAVLALAASEPTRSEKVIELPNGFVAVRQDRELWVRRRCLNQHEEEYDRPLPLSGEVEVAGRKIRAVVTRGSRPRIRDSHSVVLEAALTERGLRVRNWHAGDRYQPAHAAVPKKLKELLQARHIPRAQKPLWPVVVSGDEIVWVPGFAAPERFQPRDPDAPVLLLEEVPLRQEDKKEP